MICSLEPESLNKAGILRSRSFTDREPRRRRGARRMRLMLACNHSNLAGAHKQGAIEQLRPGHLKTLSPEEQMLEYRAYVIGQGEGKATPERP
jgi:hypothetical protein